MSEAISRVRKGISLLSTYLFSLEFFVLSNDISHSSLGTGKSSRSWGGVKMGKYMDSRDFGKVLRIFARKVQNDRRI